MGENGYTFMERVLKIVKEEQADDKPLIEFKHPKDLKALLDLEVGKEGVTDAELEECVRLVLRYSVKTGRPTFKNQLFGGTDPYGLSGAWIAEAFNTSQYTFEVAPAFTLIELSIIHHILNLFGIPEGDGIFSPGGSVSMMYAVVAARYKAYPQVKTKGVRGLPELVLFTSEDSHYSIKKAAHWLGFGTESVNVIKCNEQGQMLVKDLEAAILKEKALGKQPLMVNATAGTTVLGAIDDLMAISEICKKYNIWMHVDACWGGSLILSPTHRTELAGIERADSIAWNPHKMAGAPLQCSVLLVRMRGLLHEANCAAARYLFQQDKFYDVSYDTGDKSVQCGRKIDAFKLWVMWKARGERGLSACVERAVRSAHACRAMAATLPGFRLLPATPTPNVCFWYIPTFLRDQKEGHRWWELIHKITPKIKAMLMESSRLMVSYAPTSRHRNFFRIAFTSHPPVDSACIQDMLAAIQECGEQITMEMLT